MRVSAKSTPTDLVSELDVAAEELIRGRITDARPDDAIMGEEGDDHPGTSGRRWIVDPLDGTVNYLFGIPQWCVSVALEDEVGVVYDAMRDECWTAVAGEAPRMNGEVVTATSRTEMQEAMVATGFGYDAEVRRVQGAHRRAAAAAGA